MNILDQSSVFVDNSSYMLAKNSESASQMIKNIANIAIPVIIGQFFSLFVEMINVAYVGRLNDPAKVAGAGLGNMYVNIFCLSIVFGLNGAIATLASQAHGSGNDRRAGLYLNRGRIVIGLAFIPIISILLCTEKFLIMIKQDEQAANYAQTYAYGLIPAMIFQSQFDATRQFLNAMHKTKVVMIVNILTSCLHFLWCYLLVMVAGLDISGAALATTITYFSNFIIVTIYCANSPDLKDSFFFPDRETFKDLGDYLRIGIPSASMLCLEWWSLEVLALVAGYINVITTASFVIIVNTFCAMGMFAFGAGIAASVCVGKAVGEGDHHKAMQYSKLIVMMTFVMVIILSIFLLQARTIIAMVFTTDEQMIDLISNAYQILAGTLILHGLGLVQGGVLRGLGLQSRGTKVVLFAFYFVSLPSAYLYGIYFDMKLDGLVLGITSGSFTFALLNFIILNFTISWRKIAREIHHKMKEENINNHLSSYKSVPTSPGFTQQYQTRQNQDGQMITINITERQDTECSNNNPATGVNESPNLSEKQRKKHNLKEPLINNMD
ncbi:transparent testa 12 protein [Stylonychia lemnae]|uniref:Transparent testa 12 protein n=1 Tax=Stylonychia lemnae TaxID=5949 RepID=A0A078A987_STYLE|nr:transparent testa 12 protein [Stylonychia lemnae]|eukprot:CDW78835.1 transparent testa 12 protein [Stylonychia lemnae]